MVRPYAIKGHKRKKREENYDREEVEQLLEEETAATATQDEKKAEEVTLELPGIPLVPSNLNNKTGVTFILERACLEVAKVGKSYQLLSSEDHANFLRKNNKNPAEYRPDILHQHALLMLCWSLEDITSLTVLYGVSYAPLPRHTTVKPLRPGSSGKGLGRVLWEALLTILDSPLNKAGRLRAVYVRTEKGVLFEVKPHVRIPRTYKRFSGIMCKFYRFPPKPVYAIWCSAAVTKLSITAVGKREKLLRVIKNPVTQYLPVNSRKIGFSYSSEKSIPMRDYVAAVSDDVDLVFVVGAMAHGKISNDYTDDFIANDRFSVAA
ncbi:Ribosomal RNA small subunit methyltransferase mra1 [Vitis vinifera]|uniref:Ribosomal RNA small subunit methyltransferase mra1 n=1 Tax=Vitis vinifera TaxID=29760 RepID=A0A438HXD8_VITVI|nr:Ribosomal RNA small subunit methyltransferase mra1 [Vitis vinifera]